MYKGTDNKTVISNVGVIILTILCATAAWIPAFVFPQDPLLTQGGGSLYRLLTPIINYHPHLSNTITLVLLMGIVALQCWHAVHLRLVRTLSLLPALFILLFTGVLSSEHGISPGVPAAICLYIAFMQIITPSNNEEALWRSLEMGIFIALSSLFAPTYIYYYPLFCIGLHLVNKLTGINLLSSLIGLCTPYVLWVGFLFLTDQMALANYQCQVLSHQFCIEWLWPLHDSVIIIVIGCTLLIALMGFLHQHTDRIHPRAVSHFSFIVGFGACLLSLLYHSAHHSIVLIIFASLQLTQYFNYRSKKITTVFFYTFIACLLFVYSTQFIA